MKKITDKKTGETFMGEVWIAEIKDGKRGLKVELKTEDDVDRYEVEDAPEEKKYGGRVPKDGAKFYYISPAGAILRRKWVDGGTCKSMFECGNAFWTVEEALKELARRKAYVILKEDTKGFKPDWGANCKEKYYVIYNHNKHKLTTSYTCALNEGAIYFDNQEDARDSIEAHKQQWLDLLGIEEEE